MDKEQIIPFKKVVILGPESTGKSSLCKELALHYSAQWVPEYAREYLLTNGNVYTFENLLDVAKGQVASEESSIQEMEQLIKTLFNDKKGFPNNSLGTAQRINRIPPPLFIDTDMNVLKVWCEFVFDKCHHWILNQVVERKYDLFLLCNTDLPWIKDELREYPDYETRERLYHHYKDIMVNQRIPWVSISGNYEQRLQTAIQAVDAIL